MGKKLIIPGADFSANYVEVSLIDELLMGYHAGSTSIIFTPEGAPDSGSTTKGWMTTNIFRPLWTKLILKSTKSGTVRLRQFDDNGNSVGAVFVNTNVEFDVIPNFRTAINFRILVDYVPNVSELTVFTKEEVEDMELFNV